MSDKHGEFCLCDDCLDDAAHRDGLDGRLAEDQSDRMCSLPEPSMASAIVSAMNEAVTELSVKAERAAVVKYLRGRIANFQPEDTAWRQNVCAVYRHDIAVIEKGEHL